MAETWLAGPESDEPPTMDAEWEQLVRHLAQIHRITPESCAVSLPAAVLTMTGTASGLAAVTAEVEHLRPSGVPQDIADLVRRVTAAPLPDVGGAPHPAHQAVPPSRWLRVAEAYAACHDDQGLLARAEVQEVLMACWWAARFTG